jgi:hypothetical protein
MLDGWMNPCNFLLSLPYQLPDTAGVGQAKARRVVEYHQNHIAAKGSGKSVQ